jgi:ech hydrogenase subunit D
MADKLDDPQGSPSGSAPAAPRIPGLESQPISAIPKDRLVEEVRALHASGLRLVQIEATKLDAGSELTYSFDISGRFSSLRVTIGEGEEMPSVSGVYWAAFAYENEIHDLFGIAFAGLVLDYRGAFYRTRIPFPFQQPPAKKGSP